MKQSRGYGELEFRFKTNAPHANGSSGGREVKQRTRAKKSWALGILGPPPVRDARLRSSTSSAGDIGALLRSKCEEQVGENLERQREKSLNLFKGKKTIFWPGVLCVKHCTNLLLFLVGRGLLILL